MTTDTLENALAFADSTSHEGDLRVILHQALCASRTLAKETRRLRADLELDVEFAHAPDCTGKGISRMCAGCIEAEQLRQFAEIAQLQSLLRSIANKAPWPFHGEPDTGQYDRWFDLMKQAAEAAKEVKR